MENGEQREVIPSSTNVDTTPIVELSNCKIDVNEDQNTADVSDNENGMNSHHQIKRIFFVAVAQWYQATGKESQSSALIILQYTGIACTRRRYISW